MNGKPKITEEQTTRILRALAPGRWIKGKDLARLAGVSPRLIRAVAEETGKVISSQDGYKLTALATDEEIQAARHDLYSRASHIRQRADRLSSELLARVTGRAEVLI